MKWDIYNFETLISTNETALSYPPYSVIMTAIQTGGRGRNGRQWISPKGNFYASFVLPDFREKSPLLSYISALIVCDSLSEYKLQIKWPNDVLLEGGKLAGILLERTEQSVIVGIGVNTAQSPQQGMLYKTSNLKAHIQPRELLDRMLPLFDHYLHLFQTEGFEPIRQKWMTHALGLNQQITVRLPLETVIGKFKTLSKEGALILELEDQSLQDIWVGDVFY